MKIIYLHQYFNTPKMNGGTRSFEFGRRLVANGHEVHIITSNRSSLNKITKITIEEGMYVHWLPVSYNNSYTFSRRMSAFIKFSLLSFKTGLRLDGDLVFATSTPLTIAIPGILLSKIKRIPFVFEVRDLWPNLPISIGYLQNTLLISVAKWLEKFAYNSAKEIVALSPGMRDGIIEVGIEEKKITVIPNSCDMDLFQNILSKKDCFSFREIHKIEKHSKVVFYGGTFGKINGLEYFVRLAEKFKHNNNVVFVAVGDGAEFGKILNLAKKLDLLGNNLRILPGVSKIELARILLEVDVACSLFIDLPEMEANSANKFFDALAAGLPIMINYGGWQEDILIRENAGIRLDRNIDVASMQLKELFDNNEDLNNKGVNAKITGAKYFDRDSLGLLLNDVFCRAVR